MEARLGAAALELLDGPGSTFRKSVELAVAAGSATAGSGGIFGAIGAGFAAGATGGVGAAAAMAGLLRAGGPGLVTGGPGFWGLEAAFDFAR